MDLALIIIVVAIALAGEQPLRRAIEVARAAGIDGLAVLTGVSTAAELLAAAAHERPHLIGRDLDSLLEAHPEPVREDGGVWRCRNAAVRVADGRLEVLDAGQGQDGDGLDLLRAGCSASWVDADAGGTELDTQAVISALDRSAGTGNHGR